MVKTSSIFYGILALLSLGCHPGHSNITFLFPPKGFAYDHRNKLTQECLDGIRHDLRIINQREFVDTFTIRFLDSRQEMKQYTGWPASGNTVLEPQKIIYYVCNEKEQGAPIDHELMHLILLVDWGIPDRSSLWMNEGMAAFSQNNCNGYNDEQIYRYFADKHMLLPMDSLVHRFYQEPEMIAYHQAGCIVDYLLKNYGVERVRDLWQQGFYNFNKIFGISFSQMEGNINRAAERDYPKPPDIDWKTFSAGCT